MIKSPAPGLLVLNFTQQAHPDIYRISNAQYYATGSEWGEWKDTKEKKRKGPITLFFKTQILFFKQFVYIKLRKSAMRVYSE